MRVVVGVAGDLNATKGIPQLLDALAHVPFDRPARPRRTTRWVGRRRRDPRRRRRGPGERLRGCRRRRVPRWLSAFDILVNLRYPHRGESSGSLVASPPGGNAHDRERHRDVPRGPRRRQWSGSGRDGPIRRSSRTSYVDSPGDPEGRAAIGDRCGGVRARCAGAHDDRRRVPGGDRRSGRAPRQSRPERGSRGGRAGCVPRASARGTQPGASASGTRRRCSSSAERNTDELRPRRDRDGEAPFSRPAVHDATSAIDPSCSPTRGAQCRSRTSSRAAPVSNRARSYRNLAALEAGRGGATAGDG